MIKLKNLLVIGGVAVIAVLGISIVRAIAAPAPWEQSWPSNTAQTQTLPSKQSPADLSSSTPQSNSPSSEPASSSQGVSTISPSNPTQSTTSIQSTTPAKPDVSSTVPPAATNQASSIQSVSPQVVTPTTGTATPNGPGYWCRPMGPDFRPPYTWYPANGMGGWSGGMGGRW